MIAQSETIRAAINRSENMIGLLEESTDYEQFSPNENVSIKFLVELERYVLATLQEVYIENIGKVRR